MKKLLYLCIRNLKYIHYEINFFKSIRFGCIYYIISVIGGCYLPFGKTHDSSSILTSSFLVFSLIINLVRDFFYKQYWGTT